MGRTEPVHVRVGPAKYVVEREQRLDVADGVVGEGPSEFGVRPRVVEFRDDALNVRLAQCLADARALDAVDLDAEAVEVTCREVVVVMPDGRSVDTCLLVHLPQRRGVTARPSYLRVRLGGGCPEIDVVRGRHVDSTRYVRPGAGVGDTVSPRVEVMFVGVLAAIGDDALATRATGLAPLDDPPREVGGVVERLVAVTEEHLDVDGSVVTDAVAETGDDQLEVVGVSEVTRLTIRACHFDVDRESPFVHTPLFHQRESEVAGSSGEPGNPRRTRRHPVERGRSEVN